MFNRLGRKLESTRRQHRKIKTLLHYSHKHSIRILVETGTYHGDTVWQCRHRFRHIYTIELDESLARAAVARFEHIPNVTALKGDSAVHLPSMLRDLLEPAVFWLDAHYSGDGTAHGRQETPLALELRAIAGHQLKTHVVLIDDARLLGTGDYPTLDEIANTLCQTQPAYEIMVHDDIVRCEVPLVVDGR